MDTTQSSLYLCPADLNKMYWELLRHPDFVLQLTAYQKSKLCEYAEQIKHTASELAKGAMSGSPAYKYPEDYRGHEFEYWMDRMSTGRESRQVLQLLAANPVEATAPAPQLDAIMSKPPTAVREREKKEATLHGIQATEVRELFAQLRIGSKYTKPGEWAAAFRALFEKGVLKGNAPAVTRWGIKEGYVEESINSTLKNAWREEEAFLKSDSEKRVFIAVSKSIDKILINKKLSSTNR